MASAKGPDPTSVAFRFDLLFHNANIDPKRLKGTSSKSVANSRIRKEAKINGFYIHSRWLKGG
jgi:hypothetical protein